MARRESYVSLPALVQGFTLTIETEGKVPSTVEFLEGNLQRFLWYAREHGWPVFDVSKPAQDYLSVLQMLLLDFPSFSRLMNYACNRDQKNGKKQLHDT